MNGWMDVSGRNPPPRLFQKNGSHGDGDGVHAHHADGLVVVPAAAQVDSERQIPGAVYSHTTKS